MPVTCPSLFGHSNGVPLSAGPFVRDRKIIRYRLRDDNTADDIYRNIRYRRFAVGRQTILLPAVPFCCFFLENVNPRDTYISVRYKGIKISDLFIFF